MNALLTIENAFRDVGYRPEAVVPDYAFADVLSDDTATRKAPLVAFTRTPPSYRSAALGVLRNEGGDEIELVQAHRSLGAPFLLVIEGEQVTVWQVRSKGPPQRLETVAANRLPELFARNRDAWHPDAIHRAKSIGVPANPYQGDFIDLGLLSAIEGEIHVKLDRLLVDSLNLARTSGGADTDPRILFRVVFRLLAAKVLEDRGHPFASHWKPDDLRSVLATIEQYYGLAAVHADHGHDIAKQFEPAWQHLRAGISFSNISSDDLAFVYENTLITDETRNLFGTHSTPRQLAEYIVSRLGLHEHRPEDLKVYEPCAGAGVFLVSALRHLRDLLPDGWSDEARHAFLIDHIAGDEVDAFACEVAMLSLILADYPNHNGWHIKEIDLFTDDVLASRMASHNVILCNPPFEAFEPPEKARYAQAASNVTKALAVLSAAIDVRPLALGFVLPRAFILEEQFATQRSRLEGLYSSIEILELPDRLFGVSKVESSAVIAKHLRIEPGSATHLVSTVVADRDRQAFLTRGHVTESRETARPVPDRPHGGLWIPPLDALWTYLADHPQLGAVLRPRWGLRWKYPQEQAERTTLEDGYRPGLLKVKGFQQYLGTRRSYLDFRLENLREGYDRDWTQPKLIMNAMRLRRGPWRAGAMVDVEGLLYSQQFFGLWPVNAISSNDLFALCGVMNGPIASAFLSTHSPQDRFRARIVARLPLPVSLPAELSHLVREYLDNATALPLMGGSEDWRTSLIAKIDALTLDAYDLPAHLVEELARYFGDTSRPISHPWPPVSDTPWHIGSADDDAAELARVRRRIGRANETIQQRFLAQVPTIRSTDLAVQTLGGLELVHQWEIDRRIFSVEVDGDRLYPAFQFDEKGPKSVIKSVLDNLPATFSTWETAFWFVSINPWLDRAVPLELLSDPDRLTRAAAQAAEEIMG